ncbi:MAG: alpha/beta hydrolase [Chloroflexi bacterium]|nr:alpha/beta hydrolase [Chloroflexota bacterium]
MQTANGADVEIQCEDVTWARPDGLDLLARVYRPVGVQHPLPVLVDVHGGAWSTGDRLSGALYDTALAQSGLLVVAIDFRMGPDFKHPAASADVAAAVRWVRLNGAHLNADPSRLGLVGSSSGGHLVMLAGLKPNAPMHTGTPIANTHGTFDVHDEIDASVAYVIGLWPVSDPAARFRYARRAGIERLQAGTNAYYPDEHAQWDASIPRIVTAGEAEALPPLLIVQPGEDSNIPQDMTFDLLKAYQARGGKLDYAYYPDVPHGFGHTPSAATDDMVRLVRDFIRRRAP